MAFSDKIQDELDARLQAAFFAMKKRGKAGATAKEIAAEVLGVERADICQIRQFGMTIKAMQLRNMAYALPKEREKAATRWIAIEKSQWRHVEVAVQNAKTEADQEQREWYIRVKKKVIERREFRKKMAGIL
jgi:hypothetical protein